MNINKVPKGKTVYIKGRKFKSGDVLPPWALIEIPEMNKKDIEILIEKNESKKYPKLKKEKKTDGKFETGSRNGFSRYT